MKEIKINNGISMVVGDNNISFYYNTILSEKIFFICSSFLSMFLFVAFSVVSSICFLELLKSPNLLVTGVFCVFGAVSCLLLLIAYYLFVSGFSQYACINFDNGVMSFYSKKILSYSKTLDSDDYVIINFTRRGGKYGVRYGIAIRLKRKSGLGHLFRWRTILMSGALEGRVASYKMSRKIEEQIKEVFPDLTVINQCKERSSWR